MQRITAGAGLVRLAAGFLISVALAAGLMACASPSTATQSSQTAATTASTLAPNPTATVSDSASTTTASIAPNTTTTLPSTSGTTASTTATTQPDTTKWVKHSMTGAEIYLPSVFDVNMKDPQAVEKLRASLAADDNTEYAGLLEQLASKFNSLLVLDSSTYEDDLAYTYVGVMRTAIDPSLSIQFVVDGKLAGLQDITLLQRRDLKIDGLPATEVVYSQVGGGMTFLTYVKAVSAYWLVGSAGLSYQIENRVPEFEAIAQTFKVAK